MADFKISGKSVITQSGTAEPVLASNVTLGTGIVKAANIIDAATTTLSCTTDSTITVVTADSSSLSLGMAVSGTGIPASATIVTIPNATSFTISSAATASATNTLTFQTGIVSAKIENDAVTYAKLQNLGTANRVLGSSSTGVIGEVQIAENMIATDAVTSAKIATGAVTATEIANSLTGVKPHIQPGVLQPALRGKLLDGVTNHSGAYGTAQADGFSYYYTDIKGSKSIRDPRIGAHFGSQRHKCKSLQKLEHETATHGGNIHSVDGREWIRTIDSSGKWVVGNDDNGQRLGGWGNTSEIASIEIVGYFNDMNITGATEATDRRSFVTSLNGSANSAENNSYRTPGSTTPLAGRYVDRSSLLNLDLPTLHSASLGINTLKISHHDNADYLEISDIELIAQDTTSIATKSQIQIPSQNVVSYGKQFSLSAAAHHYNPFATKGDDSASTIPNNTTGDSVATGWAGSTSAYWEPTLDTATSLGLGAWESGGNFYRPVNGGRVVKWVDSTGAIKTSVNMMPPEAHTKIPEDVSSSNDINTGSCDATGTHNWSTKFQPTFGNKRIGSNLITGWTTTPAHPFETFTSSGANVTQAINTTGWGGAYSNTLSLTAGKLYKATITATLTSGSLPKFGFVRINNGTDFLPQKQLRTGANTLIFEASEDDNHFYLEQYNGAPCNIALSDISLYEIEQPETQTEVAKTFHYREFGNGGANGNASHIDLSVKGFTSNDFHAYVMDDGLTGFAGHTYVSTADPQPWNWGAGSQHVFFTFIGTGFQKESSAGGTSKNTIFAQNLPYGTHIVKVQMSASATWYSQITIDGVSFGTTLTPDYFNFVNISYLQPQMPPIPEDAVVLADYMLMADYVKQTDCDDTQISKGVRYVNGSRDHFAAGGGAFSNNVALDNTSQYGLTGGQTAGSTHTASWKLPFFGTTGQSMMENSPSAHSIELGGSAATETALDNSASSHGDMMTISETVTLGMTSIKSTIATGGFRFHGHHVASPIHTSSHYQSFETPVSQEILGGDRNMEQTNLVVTADGKTWDEVTRDTSYISKRLCLRPDLVAHKGTASTVIIWTYRRGTLQGYNLLVQKNFAIAYDRDICLVPGMYRIEFNMMTNDSQSDHSNQYIKINGTQVMANKAEDADWRTANVQTTAYLKRGDYVQIFGAGKEGAECHYYIEKVD